MAAVRSIRKLASVRAVGVETLAGKVGVTMSDLWPEGRIKIDEEIWNGRCAGGCGSGTTVVVRSRPARADREDAAAPAEA